MEMKYVVPDMAQSFGTLEYAGESEPIFERDKNNRRVLARRSYNLYSDVQKGENVVVEIPVQAGEKHFKYEQKVKLVNPKLCLRCDFDKYPYSVRTFARQIILRESSVTERSLVTRCRLLDAVRSDNNPQGFIIGTFLTISL